MLRHHRVKHEYQENTKNVGFQTNQEFVHSVL